MRRSRPSAALLVALLVVLALAAGAAAAAIDEYSEDFRTWQHRDSAFTTALWDTAAGQLRLPPLTLRPRGSLDTPGIAYAVGTAGAHLLVADGTGGLRVVDPADPDAPQTLGQAVLADQARAVAVAGAWAWVAVGAAGLQAVDLADPALPVPAGSADCPGFAQDVALAGDRAYVAQGASGVAVYDLADPAAPVHLADLPGRDFVRGVAAAGGLLLAADGTAGLRLYTIDGTSLPVLADTLDTAGVCQDAALAGGWAYAADGAAGLVVLAVGPGPALTTVATLALPGTAMTVTVAGDSLLVGGGNGGLHLVDVTDPATPVLVGTAPSLGWSWQGLALGADLWLADGTAGLRAFTLDPFGLDEDADEARSLNLNATTDPVRRAALVADATDSVRFFLSGDGGATWSPVAGDGTWHTFAAPTLDVRWRALLKVAGGWPGPVCSGLTLNLERDASEAEILAVSDVPGDDGGQVRVRWQASRHDTTGASINVTEYSLYRRIDAGKRWPDGSWEFVLTVPADRENEYAAVAPTLADAPTWSVFFVRTRTSLPGIVFDSPPDSGRSVADLRPAPPTGLMIDRTDGLATDLAWDPYAGGDLAHFRVYRSADAGAPPQPTTLVHVTTGTAWHDPTPGFWYYLLTAVDTAGRESLPAAAVSAVPGSALAAGLRAVVPNPANPGAAVHFAVPAPGARVRVAVHDVRGRLVRVLADGWLAGGPHHRRWDGRDAAGRAAASGVYTVRMEGVPGPRVRKLTLVR
ncbi:MAG: FlgD immunoglobulin-like domain containing protein [Candidatus Krumholzibacteriia bacterium]